MIPRIAELTLAGDFKAANAVVGRELRAPHPPAERAALLREAARLAYAMGDTPLDLQYSLSMLSLDLPHDSTWRFESHLQAARAHVALGHAAESLRLVGAALSNCRTSELASMAYMLEVRGEAFAMLGEITEGLRQFEMARELSLLVVLPAQRVRLLDNFGSAMADLGAFERADKISREAIATADQNALGWRRSWSRVMRALILLQFGHVAEAQRLLCEVRSLDSAPPATRMYAECARMRIALLVGDALPPLNPEELLRIALKSDQPNRIGYVSSTVADYFANLGDRNAAQTTIHDALVHLGTPARAWDLLVAVGAYGTAEDCSRADRLFEGWARIPIVEARRALFLAYRFSRHGDQERSLEEAKIAYKLFQELGMKVDEARSRALAGDPHGAAQLLRSIGADGEARRILNRNGGSKRGRPPTVGPGELTARQHDIYELLERGNTASQIAEELEISMNTVNHHIAEIRRKLGADEVRRMRKVVSIRRSGSQ